MMSSGPLRVLSPLLFLPLVLGTPIRAVPLSGQQLLDPRTADLLDSGERLLNSRQFDQAISQFNAALRADPSLAAAHNGLGLAYIGKDDADRAAGEFRECLRLDPRNAEAWSNLGLILL